MTDDNDNENIEHDENSPIDVEGAKTDAEAGAKQLAHLLDHSGDDWDRWEGVIIGLRGLWTMVKHQTAATKPTDYAARVEMARLLSMKKFAVYERLSKQQRSACYSLMNRIEDVSDWYHGRAGYQGYPITPDDRLNWKSPQTILKHCPPDLIGGERKLSKPPTPKPPKPKAVRPLEQAEMDRLRKLVAAILRRLAKYEPDALGLLDEIYPKQDDLNDAIPGFGDEDAAS